MRCLPSARIRNNDKVGLILFSDHVELFIPPKKGRAAHAAAHPRDSVLRAEGARHRAGRGARLSEPRAAPPLGGLSHLGFPGAGFFARSSPSPAGGTILIAIPIVDPREEELPDVGRVTLEDAETGEQIEINTSDRRDAPRLPAGGRAARPTARLREFRRKRHRYASRCGPTRIMCPRCAPFSAPASGGCRSDDRSPLLTPGRSVDARAAAPEPPPIRDIAPPVEYSRGRRGWSPCVVIGALLALARPRGADRAGGRQARRRRRRRRRGRSRCANWKRCAREVQTLDPYAFSIAVSDVLRTLHRRAVSACTRREQTSPEFLAAIAQSPKFSRRRSHAARRRFSSTAT